MATALEPLGRLRCGAFSFGSRFRGYSFMSSRVEVAWSGELVVLCDGEACGSGIGTL